MFVIPQQPSIGELLGQGLADVAGYWAGIRSTEKALRGLNFSPAEAKAYAHLGPQVQQQAIQGRQHQQQQKASNAAISQILGTGLGAGPQAALQQYEQQPMQPQPQRPQMTMQPMNNAAPQEAAVQQATSIAQNPAFRKLQEQQQQAQALQNKQLTQGAAPAVRQATAEQQAILQSQAPKEPTIKEQIEQVRNQKRALTAANLPVNQTIALHQQLENKEKELRKEAREERKEERVDQRLVDRETAPVYHEVNKAAKAAKDSNIRLGRMEQLIKGGKISNTGFYNGIKALSSLPGIGGLFESIAESFKHPDAQEFEKLSTDFVKDAKQFFGNRVTQQEVQLFLKTVPTLSQTNLGKQRVIRNMRIFNEAAQLRKNTMDEIIKTNGGKRPADLESLIESRVEPELDRLAAEFKG